MAKALGDRDFDEGDKLDKPKYNVILWKGMRGNKPDPAVRDGRELSENRPALLEQYGISNFCTRCHRGYGRGNRYRAYRNLSCRRRRRVPCSASRSVTLCSNRVIPSQKSYALNETSACNPDQSVVHR